MQITSLRISEFIEAISSGKCPDDECFDHILETVKDKIHPSLYPTQIITTLNDFLEWSAQRIPEAGKLYDAVLRKTNERVCEIDVNFYMRYLLTLARIKTSKLGPFESVMMLADLAKGYKKMNNPVFESELLALYLSTLLTIYGDDKDYRKKLSTFFEEENMLEEINIVSDLLKAVNAFKAEIDGEAARTIIQFA